MYNSIRWSAHIPLMVENTSKQKKNPIFSAHQHVSQPRTQALSTTRLAGGKTLVQAGHVSPRFWEITIGTYRG